MRKEIKRLTTAQFAKLHEVNKRTLHYYDEIGLFRPLTKAENGYRYYDISQSIDFEYIRMLKEFYLFTDTSCNYGFYEHQGMKRRLEKKHVFNIKGQQAVMNFFIYDYQLSN